ncbi:AbrB/MazE/SpoVT family DNA-binding domain-containing protein [Thiothrix unzii]|jgi:AbrB family looped-hinge helix DNA binding protein|uniref:AbrB/MazE/SpoVT family DNA-binding domain-containing protein n=1 Tax=Thiothrix unzii TaxID=111769 RepID=A0A975FA42_9GAMM|nr:AbrB/MazE/SpoVT family DNA-binding domain-containing protein [Thiothrix unzii]MDX9987305.1 AbrB/MazE/SpoVT family DNA-binding domain-containing protein [Thiothrix unzii]QTR53175.1 AbrB/MazE/SpoVT family DNA-binding domain-containing protein [Thiothrix unzii]
MQMATISPKFQVVIPRAIREPMGIQVGQKIQVLRYGNRIELIPFKIARELRGFLKGINTTVERETDRV